MTYALALIRQSWEVFQVSPFKLLASCPSHEAAIAAHRLLVEKP